MTSFLISLGATYSSTILNNHSKEATANNNTYLYLAKFAAFRISNYILNQQECHILLLLHWIFGSSCITSS